MKIFAIIYIVLLCNYHSFGQKLTEDKLDELSKHLIKKHEIYDSLSNSKKHIKEIFYQKFFPVNAQSEKEIWRFETTSVHVIVYFFVYNKKEDSLTIIDYNSLEDLMSKLSTEINNWGNEISEKDKIYIYDYVLKSYKRNYFLYKN